MIILKDYKKAYGYAKIIDCLEKNRDHTILTITKKHGITVDELHSPLFKILVEIIVYLNLIKSSGVIANNDILDFYEYVKDDLLIDISMDLEFDNDEVQKLLNVFVRIKANKDDQ